MNLEFDRVIIVLLVIVIVFFAIALLVVLATKMNNFSRELNYLNREIERSKDEEREYWKREKRRLWLSLLPFCRR